MSEFYFHSDNETCKYYTLQFSNDARSFKDIYEIPAKGGGDYNVTIPFQAGFYRLCIHGEKDNYSNVIRLTCESSITQQGNQIIVRSIDPATVSLYDVSGRLINQIKGVGTIYLNTPSVRGVYIIKIQTKYDNTVKERYSDGQ